MIVRAAKHFVAVCDACDAAAVACAASGEAAERAWSQSQSWLTTAAGLLLCPACQPCTGGTAVTILEKRKQRR